MPGASPEGRKPWPEHREPGRGERRTGLGPGAGLSHQSRPRAPKLTRAQWHRAAAICQARRASGEVGSGAGSAWAPYLWPAEGGCWRKPSDRSSSDRAVPLACGKRPESNQMALRAEVRPQWVPSSGPARWTAALPLPGSSQGLGQPQKRPSLHPAPIINPGKNRPLPHQSPIFPEATAAQTFLCLRPRAHGTAVHGGPSLQPQCG